MFTEFNGLSASTYSKRLHVEQQPISSVNALLHGSTYCSSLVWISVPRLHVAEKFVSVLGSVVVLITFNSTDTQTITVVVRNPSLSTYEELTTFHSSALACACSNSTMPYGSFVSLSAIFHQICSSDLVSNEWISLLVETFAGWAAEHIWIFGSKKYFESIATLCELANQTANYNIDNLLAQTFATTDVLVEKDFNIQLDIIINQFIQSIGTSFSLFIRTTRLMIQVDQPLPALASGT